MDLGQSQYIDKIKLWRYFADARAYHDVIIQVSNDVNFATGVKTVFNNDTNNSASQGAGTDSEYAETSAGKEVSFAPTYARYVRVWSNGSGVDTNNHIVELQVFKSCVVMTYSYDSFGNIVEQNGNVDNNITYAGYQYDKDTGLYYLNARMYDPTTARFLQEDTYAGDTKDPLSLNLYTYCHNEPLIYTDPSGYYEVALRSFVEEAGGKLIWIPKGKYAMVYYNGKLGSFYTSYNSEIKKDNKMYIDTKDFDQMFQTNTHYEPSKGNVIDYVSDKDFYFNVKKGEIKKELTTYSSFAGGNGEDILPTTGSELEKQHFYESLFDTNCYGYALDLKKFPDGESLNKSGLKKGIQPGDVARHISQKQLSDFQMFYFKAKKDKGEKITEQDWEIRNILYYRQLEANNFNLREPGFDNIMEGIMLDAEVLGVRFKVVKEDEVMDGTYKAMVKYGYKNLLGTEDFHFVRQNPDGTWESKIGLGPIKNDGYNPKPNGVKYQFFVIGRVEKRMDAFITK